MIYVNMDQETWMKKYPLEAKDYRCPCCGETFQTTVPFITNDCAGLASPTHECGPGYVGYVLTPRKTEAEDFWRTVLS